MLSKLKCPDLRTGAVLLSVALGLGACGGGGGAGNGAVGGNAPASAVQAAAIAVQPAPQSADAGANATFTVNATGTSLRYQWRRDGKDIPGAVAASYTLNDVQFGDEGAVFTVEVGNDAGRVVSSGAPLKVTTPKGLSLLAGRLGGPGNLDGRDARFRAVSGIALDPSGQLLVSDAVGFTGSLRGVDPATGATATLATYPVQAFSYLMEVDAAGNRYDMTGWAIYKTTPAGVRTLLAGLDTQSYDYVDGTGAQARFHSIYDMTIDGAGNLYVTDDNRIRRIDPSGTVSTLAGSAGSFFPVDGVGRAASFRRATMLAADRTGNLVVLDAALPTLPLQLRKVTPAGVVTTLTLKAGDETGPVDSFGENGGALAIDDAGTVYVTDTSYGCRIRRIAPDGTVTNLAGSATEYGNVDAKGGAARFCAGPGGPLQSMTIDKSGNLYLYDVGNYTLRRITPAGDVTTVAGRAPARASEDGAGRGASFAASPPMLRLPTYFSRAVAPVYSLAADTQGNVFVGEGARIRKVSPSGTVATMATLVPAAGEAYRTYYFPGSLAAGGDALVVTGDVIGRVDAAGAVRFVAGQVSFDRGAVDGAGAAASFGSPYDLVVDGLGNIYLHDVVYYGGQPWNGTVVDRRIGPDGAVTTLPASASGSPIVAWQADKEGGVWAASQDGAVSRIGTDGTRKVVLPAADGRHPTALARDAAGNLYLAMSETIGPNDPRGVWYTVHRFAPDGTETIVAGTEGTAGVRLGAPGSLARVQAMAAGADGILYLMTENAVLKLKP